MVELLLCSELVPTLAKQFGLTVISPIASDDVHFLRSSIAAGCNYTRKKTSNCECVFHRDRDREKERNSLLHLIIYLFIARTFVSIERMSIWVIKIVRTTRLSISASIFFVICRRVWPNDNGPAVKLFSLLVSL